MKPKPASHIAIIASGLQDKPATAAKIRQMRIHLIQSTWRRVVARKRGNQ